MSSCFANRLHSWSVPRGVKTPLMDLNWLLMGAMMMMMMIVFLPTFFLPPKQFCRSPWLLNYGSISSSNFGITQLLDPGSFDHDPKMITDATTPHSDEKKSHRMKIDGARVTLYMTIKNPNCMKITHCCVFQTHLHILLHQLYHRPLCHHHLPNQSKVHFSVNRRPDNGRKKWVRHTMEGQANIKLSRMLSLSSLSSCYH